MTRDREPDRGAALGRIASLMRAAGAKDVAPEQHRAGREALLAALDRRAALPPRRRGGLLLVAAAALIAAAIAIAWPARQVAVVQVEGGAIAAGGYLAPTGGGPATVRFSDGSALTLRGGGRGRVAELGPRGARVVLEEGAAEIQVAPRPGAAWSIEAGPFVIAVTGTAFEVTWSAAAQELAVRMREGSVVVRGPMAPAGVALSAGQRLTARVAAGELRIEADAATHAAARHGEPSAAPAAGEPPHATVSRAAPTSAPAAPGAAAAAPPEDPAAPAPAAAPASSWGERVAAGDFAGVVAEAEARGLDGVAQQAPLADLVALADAARYARRTDVARRALAAQRARFPGTAAAATAAFLLGRIADDAQGSPAAAISLYDQYLAEAPGGAFAAEALGRKMVALSRTAGSEAARPVAAEVLRRHPRGPYAAAARALLGDAGAPPDAPAEPVAR